MIAAKPKMSKKIALEAFELMATAKAMTELYEEHFKFVSKYVHATSRGHEAIQLAVGMQLLPQDYAWPYYRDDSILLGMGLEPFELMLQLMAKKDDPFSGGRSYYCHPSLRRDDKPKIPHQSSATGMQAIPATGAAMGMQYKELEGLAEYTDNKPLVVCSLGDASVTEGEVAEAFQMAALKQLPILYLVQDNGWDISANAEETRAQDADEYIKGFHGIESRRINGSDFFECYETVREVLELIRTERRPFLIHATVPLLNHHTSGVRKEWYRDDLEEHQTRDPYPLFWSQLMDKGFKESELRRLVRRAERRVAADYEKARNAEDPSPESIFDHAFAPAAITEEQGQRAEEGKSIIPMVDAALHAVKELMEENQECLLYGQDVGHRLGGVFREAATLSQRFGKNRVFNTPIQEAFIIGSTVGMSAVGLKPIVEVQFADYIWPGLNQLFTEVSRSCYLSQGKWPVSCIIRVPIGAYGSGGPYHSSSVETVVANIRGIKIAYPSTAADMKGLMKSAYYDPNPVVIFEHKGLYWSKVSGTKGAMNVEPSSDYAIPFGKARIALEAEEAFIEKGESLLVISYGRGVHWSLNGAESHPGQIEIIDLRTLAPLDEATVFEAAKRHGRILIVTEDIARNSFAESFAQRIQEKCFEFLDAPVKVIGAEEVPAIPLNSALEMEMFPSKEKVAAKMQEMLDY
jgi:2-oxoisovalerate dehydrogenase E1 component